MNRFGVLVLVTLAFALPACGGDDDDGGSATTGSAPTTAEEARTATEPTETAAEGEGEERAPAGEEDGDGGGEGQDPEPPAPTLAEYIRSADRICREAQSALARRGTEYRKLSAALARGKIKPPEYYRRGGELTELSGELAERAVADLKALELPRSRREAIEAYLEGAATQAEILTEQGEALRQGRSKEVARLNRRMAQVAQETRRAVQRVGFRACGGGS